MQHLEKRIAELEKAQSINDGVQTIIVRFINPGISGDDLQALHAYSGGQHWTRDPSESERDLIDRATREVERKGPGCVLLLQSDVTQAPNAT